MMTVRAVEKGTGRVRTGRIGGGSGSGGGVAPAFQADFTALSALPAGVLFSRASNAMVYDSTGKLTYAPNNLMASSNSFADWTLNNATLTTGQADPSGGISATKLAATATASDCIASAPISAPASGNVMMTADVKADTSNWCAFSNAAVFTFFNLGTGAVGNIGEGTAGIISLTGGWYRCWWRTDLTHAAAFRVRVATANGDQSVTAGASIIVANGTYSNVTYETTPRASDLVVTTSAAYYGPRSDFAWNGSAWVAVGLLIEEQRTNSLLYSNDLSNAAWIKSGSPTPTVTLSGDVWTLVTTQAYTEYITQNIAPVSNGTFSIYARVTSGTGVTYLSVLNGTTGWAGATTATCNLTTAWQRFSVTTSNSTEYVVIGNTQSDAATPHNDASTSIEIRYFQFEAGPFLTSYIPTSTAAVTRSADIAQLTGAAQAAMQAVASTVLVEVDQVQGDYAQLMGADGSTVIARDGANTGRLYTEAVSPSLNVLVDTTATFRAGVSKDGSGVSFVSNGGTVSTSSNPGTDFTGRNFRVGSRVDGYFINAHLRSIGIDTTRYSNADLQAKSVVGAAF